MRVAQLLPAPDRHTQFAWSHNNCAPDQAGCYVLATFNNDVLYVGLATKSIRNRMANHLDTPEKRKGNDLGVPFWFYYIEKPSNEVRSIERGWMNQAILTDGDLPPLNRVYSPL